LKGGKENSLAEVCLSQLNSFAGREGRERKKEGGGSSAPGTPGKKKRKRKVRKKERGGEKEGRGAGPPWAATKKKVTREMTIPPLTTAFNRHTREKKRGRGGKGSLSEGRRKETGRGRKKK